MSTRDETGKFARTFEPDAAAEADILARRKSKEPLASIAGSYDTSAATLSRYLKNVKQRKATEAKERRAARETEAAAQPERSREQPVPAPDTQELTSVVRRPDGSASITVAGKGPLRINLSDDGLEEEMRQRGMVRVTPPVSLFRGRDGW